MATCVDHVREIQDGGEELDASNLMSLCDKCHARKTKRMARAREAGREAIDAYVRELKTEGGEGDWIL